MNSKYEIRASSLTYDEMGNIIPPKDWLKCTIANGNIKLRQRAPVMGNIDAIAHDDL